ncbi:hypothetical protein BH23BAC4_BH23BAC4_10050 [soil metagenome]
MGAVAGALGYTLWVDSRYRLYRRAFRYIDFQEGDPNVPHPENPFADDYDAWVRSGSRSGPVLRQGRESARRARDLAGVGTVVVYALQALDAYVAANLLDFDVGDDFALRPTHIEDGFGVAMTFRFNVPRTP